MNFKIEKLIFRKKSIDEILERSKKFYITIKKRRTIRDFDKEKVDINIIKNAILSAGTAPNGANLQPWHFVVINDSNIKKKIRIAAENEEEKFYKFKAPKEWIKALEPLGTDQNKKFIEDAPVLIAIFEKKYSIEKNQKIKNYYVRESVGIATGILISCLHLAGLCMLTHTPSPMTFLNKILKRPINEKPFLLLVVGFPHKNCHIPLCAKKKKRLKDITSYF